MQFFALPPSAESEGFAFSSCDAFGACASGAGTSYGDPYINKLEAKIGKFWQPPKGKQWKDLTIEVKIRQNGTISQVETRHSSGSSKIDKLAVQALEKAEPFPNLPGDFSTACFLLHFESREPLEYPKEPIPTVKDNRQSKSEIRAGGRSPSVVALPDVDFGPYMADLQRHLRRAWKPVSRPDPKTAVVVFQINKGGTVSHLRLERSSGDSLVDKAALDAVTDASPVRALPDGASDDVDIQFTFDQTGLFGMKKEGESWVGWIYGPDDPRRGVPSYTLLH
jgi:TonB family protein